VAGSGRKRGKLRNIAQYFAIEKMQRGGSPKNTGREPGLKGTGSGRFKPPGPLPSPHVIGITGFKNAGLQGSRAPGLQGSSTLVSQGITPMDQYLGSKQRKTSWVLGTRLVHG